MKSIWWIVDRVKEPMPSELDFTCLAESKTPHDVLDTISEIKWMDVLKSISPKKTLRGPFFWEASSRY